jgi:hypothetical protein
MTAMALVCDFKPEIPEYKDPIMVLPPFEMRLLLMPYQLLYNTNNSIPNECNP